VAGAARLDYQPRHRVSHGAAARAGLSRFEYFSVLISIVIALGISEMASCWGALLRQRREVRFYWVHALWTVFAVLLLVQFWWGFWNFRSVETWSFPALLAVVTEALVLVLAAMVLTPRAAPKEVIDLRSHYYQQSRVFFCLGAFLLVQLAIVDSWVSGQPFFHAENAVRALGLFAAVSGALSRNERVHQALVVAALVLLFVFTFVAFGS